MIIHHQYQQTGTHHSQPEEKQNKRMDLIFLGSLIFLIWLNIRFYTNNEMRKQIIKSTYETTTTQIQYFWEDIFRINLATRKKILNINSVKAKTHFNIIQYKNLTDQTIPYLAYKRIELGQPVSPYNNAQKIRVWTILNYQKSNQQHCLVINGLNGITTDTIFSIKQLLFFGEIGKILIYTSWEDRKAEEILLRNFKNKQKNFYTKHQNVAIDSDYGFILNYCRKCRKICYSFSHFVINSGMAKNILQQMNAMSQFSLYFSSKVQVQKQNHSLTDLRKKDLQTIPLSDLYSYVYIFDSSFLKYITPLNFAYFTRYSFQQIIILPILSIVHQSGNIYTSDLILHSMRSKQNYLRYNLCRVHQPNEKGKTMCFVSYPSNPQQINGKQFNQYLNSIISNQRKGISLSSIVYLPYKYTHSQQIFNIIKDIHEKYNNASFNFTRIRFRIFGNKTFSSHAVYDAVYAYCPDKTIMVSSRHNVEFLSNFSQEIISSIRQQKHYYHTNFVNELSQIIQFNEIPTYKQPYAMRRSDLFEKYFRHFQIFKSDFLKTNLFWVLKSEELEFYQTQSPFVVLMLESARLSFQYINKTLVSVSARNYTATENKQITNVKSYAQYFALIENKLFPYPFSCLQNRAYAPYAPERMQKIIHQIWLSKQEISPIRLHLQKTIIQANPRFDVKLWKFSDVTPQNFPHTYHIVIRALQFHKTSQTSYFTLVADLLRYQLIYRYGGIYIDFKMEGLKAMDPFLKYEVFYLDCDISQIRFQNPKVIGLGVMGGIKNSYYFKNIINELIYEANIDFQKVIPRLTGSWVSRKSFNDEEFFTVLGLGFQLLYPLPYQEVVNACGGVNKTFDSDQTVYTITDFHSKLNIKIGIPCKEYPQAYLVSFAPLAKTWLYQKRSNN